MKKTMIKKKNDMKEMGENKEEMEKKKGVARTEWCLVFRLNHL